MENELEHGPAILNVDKCLTKDSAAELVKQIEKDVWREQRKCEKVREDIDKKRKL